MSGEGSALIKGPLLEAPMQFRLQPGGARSGDGCFLRCPKCDAPAAIRRSDRPTPTVTQLIAICSDVSGCGHSFRADIVFVHTLSPGLIERPDLNLPVCPRDQVPHVRPPARGQPDDMPSFFDSAAAA